jgi:hypothetical protein
LNLEFFFSPSFILKTSGNLLLFTGINTFGLPFTEFILLSLLKVIYSWIFGSTIESSILVLSVRSLLSTAEKARATIFLTILFDSPLVLMELLASNIFSSDLSFFLMIITDLGYRVIPGCYIETLRRHTEGLETLNVTFLVVLLADSLSD